MTTAFRITNDLFDTDFENFDYNENDLQPSIHLIVVEDLLPDVNDSGSLSPQETETPPCTPISPLLECEQYEEEDEERELIEFTDESPDDVIYPAPTYPLLNREQELCLVLQR